MALPPGFQSTTGCQRHEPLLLVRYRRRLYALLFNKAGNIVLDAEQRDQIMAKIRCTPGTLLSPHMPDDDAFDAWIDRARTTSCQQYGYLNDEAQILCSMALLSS